MENLKKNMEQLDFCFVREDMWRYNNMLKVIQLKYRSCESAHAQTAAQPRAVLNRYLKVI